MILINLLPHRAEKRRRRKVAFFSGIAVAALVGLMVVGLWFAVVQQLTSGQQERNAFLGREIQTLEAQIRDIAGLKSEIEALKARQKAVEDLQSDRNTPVHLLNELVKQTPEGIYFKSVKQEGQSLNISGVAQTNERVSEFLRNTNNNSDSNSWNKSYTNCKSHSKSYFNTNSNSNSYTINNCVSNSNTK